MIKASAQVSPPFRNPPSHTFSRFYHESTRFPFSIELLAGKVCKPVCFGEQRSRSKKGWKHDFHVGPVRRPGQPMEVVMSKSVFEPRHRRLRSKYYALTIAPSNTNKLSPRLGDIRRYTTVSIIFHEFAPITGDDGGQPVPVLELHAAQCTTKILRPALQIRKDTRFLGKTLISPRGGCSSAHPAKARTTHPEFRQPQEKRALAISRMLQHLVSIPTFW